MTMTTHKGKHLIGAGLQSEVESLSLSSWQKARGHTSRPGTGEGAESSNLDLHAESEMA